MMTSRGASCPDETNRSLFLITVLVLAMTLPAGRSMAGATMPQLTSDTDIATAGFYRLTWKTTQAGAVELQEATDPAFRNTITFYKGPDRATVISGKPNGTWYYRVRALIGAQPGTWSEPVAVKVSHHSLSRALLFFGLGVVVFLATLTMVFRAAGKAR